MSATKINVWLKSIFRRGTTKGTAAEMSQTDHVELTRLQIIEAIVNSLIPLVGNRGVRSVMLWAHDAVVYQALLSPGVKDELATAFDNAELYELGRSDIHVRQGIPRDVAFTSVLKDKLDVTLHREDEDEVQGNMQCTLSLVKGSGSMEPESFTIAGSDHEKRYRIGRGRHIRRRGFYRVNDIVIRNDEPDEVLKINNMHVSSNHADVIAKNGRFFLQVMEGGCDSETNIIHGGQSTTLDNTNWCPILYDGDIIELGGRVCLEVRISQAD